MNKCIRYVLLEIFVVTFPLYLQGSFAAKAVAQGLQLGGSISVLAFGLPYILIGALLNPRTKERIQDVPTDENELSSTEELSEITEPEPTSHELAPAFKSPVIVPPIHVRTKKRKRKIKPIDLQMQPTIQPLSAQPIVPLNIPQTVQTIIQELPKKTDHPVFINLNLNNQQALTTTHCATKSSTDNAPITTTTQTPVFLPEPQISQSLTKERSKSFSPFKLFLQKTGSALSWIGTHKIRFLSYCLLGAYGGVSLYLWNAFRTLTKPGCWSLWKKFCSLPDLYQTNKEELINGMKTSFKEAYTSDNELLNGERFIQESQKELVLLNSYKSALERVSSWHLNRIFFLQKLPIESIIERIHRLEFMQKIVGEWLTETKKNCSYESLFCRC